MKYLISVPFMLKQIDDYGIDGFIEKLKEMNADIVFLALDAYETDEGKRERVFNSLRRNVPIFQKAGFKVGVWVWAFLVYGDKKYEHITSLSGKVSQDQVCPSDEEFCQFAANYYKNIALSKPDIILFDDDYRYGFLDCGLGCGCKNHRKYMSELIGEEISIDGLANKVWSGKGNKYRSAWLKANGHFFKEFAKKIRRAIDEVDPSIRLGPCACMTTWDFDGISAVELAKIMAGNTKPFLRLAGAPYWAINRNWGNRLQDVIELERMESSWCGDLKEIDVLSECDAFPRPRCACPASYMECFDMALRASGAVTGTHKYVLDYVSNTDYERGYIEKDKENRAIYQKIEELFSGKEPVGVRIYERMNKFENMEVPTAYAGGDGVQNLFFSPAARMLATQTIPTIYKGLGVVGMAFGENVKYLDEGALNNGLLLDASAAKILTELGVDVGLENVGEEMPIDKEYFVSDDNYINLIWNSGVKISVKSGVRIESYFTSGDERYIASYSYENAQGQKFLVYAVNGYSMGELFFRQRARGEQIVKFIEGLGKRLPATLLGNPDCYMLCKEQGDSLAVWLGNFFADEVFNKTVTLAKEYDSIEFIGCSGRLEKDKVILEGLAPFTSAGFVVKR